MATNSLDPDIGNTKTGKMESRVRIATECPAASIVDLGAAETTLVWQPVDGLIELDATLIDLLTDHPMLLKRALDRRNGKQVDGICDDELTTQAISHIVQVDEILNDAAAMICRV